MRVAPPPRPAHLPGPLRVARPPLPGPRHGRGAAARPRRGRRSEPSASDASATRSTRAGLTPPELFLDRFPHELSGGQRQRVAIAASLVLDPKLLVADEPVSMLDVSVRAGILTLLDELRRSGLGILMITHDLSTAAHFADRIAVMYLGRIVEEGPAREVVSNPKHPYTKALISVVPQARPARDDDAADPARRDAEPDRDPARLPVQPALPDRDPGVPDRPTRSCARRRGGGRPPRSLHPGVASVDLVLTGGSVFTADAAPTVGRGGRRPRTGASPGSAPPPRSAAHAGPGDARARARGPHGAPRLPGRAPPPAEGGLELAPLRPPRRRLARGVPRGDRPLRGRAPRARVDRRRRLVDGLVRAAGRRARPTWTRSSPTGPSSSTNRDGHGAWVNTARSSSPASTPTTPDPPDGRIERDATGEPPGTLHEGAMGLVERLFPPTTPEEWEAGDPARARRISTRSASPPGRTRRSSRRRSPPTARSPSAAS